MLAARLQGLPAPGEIEAGERGRRLVLAAFAERTPVRRRRLRMPRLVWPVLAALLAAGAVAVAGAAALGRLADARCARRSRRSRSRAAWCSRSGAGSPTTVDGARTRARARARDATEISRRTARTPSLASGSALVAVHVADGQVRWRVPAPGRVSLPRWSVERTVPPCCRVAYLARGALYAVGGRRAGRPPRGARMPSQSRRPGARRARHVLAFATPGAIRVVGCRQPRPLWSRCDVSARPLALSWRADGRVLAVLDATGVTLYAATGARAAALRARRERARRRLRAGGQSARRAASRRERAHQPAHARRRRAAAHRPAAAGHRGGRPAALAGRPQRADRRAARATSGSRSACATAAYDGCAVSASACAAGFAPSALAWAG